MLSPHIQKLIQKYQKWHSLFKAKKERVIFVDEIASRVASFYEKIRGIIEWREEHLLRKTAIERVLRRRLVFQKSGEEIAEPLVLELIRGGHFPNGQIEESKIDQVKKILDKYIFIFENNSPPPSSKKSKTRLFEWLLGGLACEIEETLSPPIRELALIECMTNSLKERVEVAQRKVIEKKMPEKEKEIQLFIAVQKALFKFDEPLISYHLLKKMVPDWENLSPQRLKEITCQIYSIWDQIEKSFKHPLSEKFYQVAERYDTPYLILGDILSKDPLGAFKNLSQPKILEELIRESYQERLKKLRKRLKKAALFSTISIFVTKMLLAFAIEIPFDKYVLATFSYQSLFINILVPPFLMFVLVATIKTPQKENLNRVILEVMRIVYPSNGKEIEEIKPPRKKGIILSTIIGLFYLLTFVLSFWVIIWLLRKVEFGGLSIGIFLMFFCLIFFAGVKTRERSKELQVIEEKTTILSFLFDTFSLPFIRMGKWLSGQLSRYNIIVFLFSAFLDLPFQLFTEFLEHWRSFIKEKKEEIH